MQSEKKKKKQIKWLPHIQDIIQSTIGNNNNNNNNNKSTKARKKIVKVIYQFGQVHTM